MGDNGLHDRRETGNSSTAEVITIAKTARKNYDVGAF
jgi:hypothetical protein